MLNFSIRQTTFMKSLTALCCLAAITSFLRAQVSSVPTAGNMAGTTWALKDTRGACFELRLGSEGKVVIRRLKTRFRRDPRNEFGPGLPSYEIEILDAGKWVQHDSAVEFSIEEFDITNVPAGTHPIEIYHGSVAGSTMAGKVTSTTWGPWEWTAELIRDPKVRGDGPPLILLADTPSFPSASDRRSGEATVRITVSPTGDVLDVTVVKTTHKEFGEAAKEAVAHWKFIPRVRGGAAIPSSVVTTIAFQKTRGNDKTQ
jgi:TonB family protein